MSSMVPNNLPYCRRLCPSSSFARRSRPSGQLASPSAPLGRPQPIASNSASHASRADAKWAHLANSCGPRSRRISAASAANRSTRSSIATAGDRRTFAGALAHGAWARLNAPTSSMLFIDVSPLIWSGCRTVFHDRRAPISPLPAQRPINVIALQTSPLLLAFTSSCAATARMPGEPTIRQPPEYSRPPPQTIATAPSLPPFQAHDGKGSLDLHVLRITHAEVQTRSSATCKC